MKAAFLAVGSELLGTERLDTNSLRATALLRQHGVELKRKAVVGDDEAELEKEIAASLGSYDLLLVSGGLGPTSDDRTREAVARATGRSLVPDAAIVADLEAKFRSFGRQMPAVNRRQAEVPAGATVLANPRGTAPGLRLEVDGTTVFLLPGVPRELDGLLRNAVQPWLAERSDGQGIETAVLKLACLAESEVEERLAPAYERWGRETISVLASPGEIELHLTVRGPAEERRRRLTEMSDDLAALVGRAVFSRQASDSLEAVVGRLLEQRCQTVATAESCTGGLVAGRITSVAGSSAWYRGSVVAYDDAVKNQLLGVGPEVLREHGAVSEPTARLMVAGVKRLLGTDWAVSVTGIAGPGGGTEEKPVGTVCLAVQGPAANAGDLRTVQLPGDRQQVRRQASQLALELLRRRLLAAHVG